MIGMENQFDISGVFEVAATSGFEAAHEIVSAINPRVGDNPNVVIQAEWLPLAQRLIRRAQHSVAESDIAINPCLLRIGAPEGHETSHSPHQLRLNRRVIKI
jgi:hypothetical protein